MVASFFVVVFETGSCYIAQNAGLENSQPLLLPPKCWDSRHAPPQPGFGNFIFKNEKNIYSQFKKILLYKRIKQEICLIHTPSPTLYKRLILAALFIFQRKYLCLLFCFWNTKMDHTILTFTFFFLNNLSARIFTSLLVINYMEVEEKEQCVLTLHKLNSCTTTSYYLSPLPTSAPAVSKPLVTLVWSWKNINNRNLYTGQFLLFLKTEGFKTTKHVSDNFGGWPWKLYCYNICFYDEVISSSK
jgi:hypothetical protein